MKKKIALITGGYSGEAVISYKSADNIEKHLDTDKWETYKIDINPAGWNYLVPAGKKIPVDKNDFSITVAGQKINFDAVCHLRRVCHAGPPILHQNLFFSRQQ